MTGPTRREVLFGIIVGAAVLVVALALTLWWDRAGSWSQRTAVGYEIFDDDPTRLVVMGGCNPEIRARLIDEDDLRVVVVLETRGERLGDCLGGGEVSLRAPVGSRAVVDLVSGDDLPSMGG